MKTSDNIKWLESKLEILDRTVDRYQNPERQLARIEEKLNVIFKYLETEHDMLLEEIPLKKAHYVLKEEN